MDKEFASLLRADANSANRLVFEDKFRHVRVQPDLQVVAGFECGGVQASEVRFRAPAREIWLQ